METGNYLLPWQRVRFGKIPSFISHRVLVPTFLPKENSIGLFLVEISFCNRFYCFAFPWLRTQITGSEKQNKKLFGHFISYISYNITRFMLLMALCG